MVSLVLGGFCVGWFWVGRGSRLFRLFLFLFGGWVRFWFFRGFEGWLRVWWNLCLFASFPLEWCWRGCACSRKAVLQIGGGWPCVLVCLACWGSRSGCGGLCCFFCSRLRLGCESLVLGIRSESIRLARFDWFPQLLVSVRFSRGWVQFCSRSWCLIVCSFGRSWRGSG